MMNSGCKKERNAKNSKSDMVNLSKNVDQKDDMTYNRRAFLKTAAGTSIALGLSTLPFSVRAMMDLSGEELEQKAIGNLDQLPEGESLTFYYPTEDDPAILVHTAKGELVAYNSACTHLMCPVFYKKETDVLLCPCHQGYFDVSNGHPVAGPPQRELPMIDLEVKDGKIYAVGRTYRHG